MENTAKPTAKWKLFSEMTPKEQRDFLMRKIKSNHKFIQNSFQKEVRKYLKIYRNQFSDVFPDELFHKKNVDVNIVYPILKTLLPKLYFQDPKVYVKALQETVEVPQTQVVEDPMTGEQSEEPVIDPLTGVPLVDTYDGVESGKIIQGQVNYNIRQAKLKNHVKMAIYDAHLGYYGAIKTGFGNNQGVQAMGEGAPVSPREDIDETMNYGVRMAPWDVVPDLSNFYNQEWTALYYSVHPATLMADSRLKHTERITGKAKLSERIVRERGQFMDESDKVLTEYYEIYIKPSAQYPNGVFAIISEEVDDDFLYIGDWPYESKGNPIKFLYFNPDPEGGLPIPPVRYYIAQQNQKSMHRRIAKEYVERALPFVGVDLTSCKDQKLIEKALESGQVPKFVRTDGRRPSDVFYGVSHPPLGSDFYKFDDQIDDDVSRMTGMIVGVYPGSGENVDLASVAKMQNSGDAVRQGELSDVVTEFLKDILNQWVDYLKEYAGIVNWTMVEGEQYPRQWTRDQIRLRTDLEIKPFSMTYEDPMIVRRQWVDLLNLFIAPDVQLALMKQNAKIDYVKIVKRVLETYQERDVETFMLSGNNRPENQVQQAIQEGMDMMAGVPHEVKPGDNDIIHILIHNMQLEAGNPFAAEAIKMHEQNMLGEVAEKSGGGNAENPNGQKGNAVSQEMMKEPLKPSSQNSKNAQVAKATKAEGTR